MSTLNTNSLDLSAWLLTQGAPFPEVNFDATRHRCSFVFDDPEGEWGWQAQNWYCGGEEEPQCSAKRLLAAFRKLRQAMQQSH